MLLILLWSYLLSHCFTEVILMNCCLLLCYNVYVSFLSETISPCIIFN